MHDRFRSCPKQGTKIEHVVLNRVCTLGIFRPKQGQGFKPSAAHLYPKIGRVPPHPLLGHESLALDIPEHKI